MEKDETRMCPFVQKAEAALDRLYPALKELMEPHLSLIHTETGLEEFIIGGSWPAAMVSNGEAHIDVPLFDLYQVPDPPAHQHTHPINQPTHN